MRRLYIERAGDVILIKKQVLHPVDGWVIDVVTTAMDYIELGGYGQVWITARFKSQCNEKDCGKTIEIGDRCFIDGGRMLCEEHGKEEQETERTGEDK